jgi:hypothetical protein
MVNALMDLVKSPLKMETSIQANFITDCCMVMENSSGAMAFNTKANLQITELQEMGHIVGLMEVFMKERSKTDSDMGSVNILSKKQHIKGNGLKAKNQEKERSFSRAGVFFKDFSRTILNKVMEKCTTILQETILKASGKTTKKKVRVQ